MKFNCIYRSAGPDLLDSLDPRTNFFNCLRSGALDLVQNDSFGHLPGHESVGSDFVESSLFTFHSLCKVLDCDSQNSISVYLKQIFAILTEIITV